jgi:hypothetical protein
MLGLCAQHLFAQAVAEFYKVKKWSALVCCNNKRALELSSHHRRRIRFSTKCADIQLNLRAIKQIFTSNFKYFHVYGHMDRYLKWEQLSLYSNSIAYVTHSQNEQEQQPLSKATTADSPNFFQKKMWCW